MPGVPGARGDASDSVLPAAHTVSPQGAEGHPGRAGTAPGGGVHRARKLGGEDGEGKLEGISETRVKNRKMGVGQKEGGLVVVGD